MLTPEREARFWDKVRLDPKSSCWLWTAAKDSSGYGRFYVGQRKLAGAHRVSFMLSGRDLPEGAVVDHACRTRLCVNPQHLRAVTRLENVHENSDALAHLNALKTHCAKGHPFDDENTFARHDGLRGCRQCRAEYHRSRRRSARE